jgi:hypothetical protein
VGNLLVPGDNEPVARSARHVESVPSGLVELLPLRNALANLLAHSSERLTLLNGSSIILGMVFTRRYLSPA